MASDQTITRLTARLERALVRTQLQASGSLADSRTGSLGEGTPSLPRFSAESSQLKSECHSLQEVCALADVEFVTAAYLFVLKREPDAQGMALYLNALRGGRMGKRQIVAALRYSKEGRRVGLEVSGLWLPRATLTAGRIPFVGYVLRVLANLARLPRLSGSLQTLESLLAIRSNEITRAGDAAVEAIERQLAALAEALRQATTSSRAESLEGEARIHSALSQLQVESEARWTNLNHGQRDLSTSVRDFQGHIERRVEALECAQIPPRGIVELYADFEQQFRGSTELIKERQKVYLEHITVVADPPIAIDIGPGRGEWLELLRDNGWIGIGLDSNPIFVADGQRRGLDVRLGDAVEELRAFPNGSFSLVTAFHIIEHLSFYQLLSLLDEAHRVLRSGGMLILETPNPENLLTASCNFYFDPTHRNPIPPGLAVFLVTARGFAPAQVLRLHSDSDPIWDKVTDTTLRRLLSGPQDYAVLSRRP